MKKTVCTLILTLAILVFILAGIESVETSEPKYAPDRKVDIIHITIDVTPDFKARTIAGTVTIRFAPIAKSLEELHLDAVDLIVSHVTSSAAIDGYSCTDEAITITFDPPIMPGAETKVTIVYNSEPKRGLYFRTPEMGYSEGDIHLFTQGEAHEAPHWYPNYDYPNERSTSEVICRVPEDMIVLSNGRLVSEDMDSKTKLKSVRWLQDKPHVNYLIALVAGNFKKIEDQYNNIPLAFYTPPSQFEQAENSFEGTRDMISFFEKETGVQYPWNKYYQVVVEDFMIGGMENTTLTILTNRTLFTDASENIRSSQSLVSHELIHMWFGDYVTCKDWSHLWLNEGFATYYAQLYDGYRNGHDAMLYNLYNRARGVLASRSVHKPIVYKSYDRAWDQFDYRAYPKGGWVLHMLRTQLGEDLFRECIKTYTERHALKSVVTEDLNSVIEELSGRSFDRFFDQWVYHARHPDLKISYSWSGTEKLAKLTVEQTHKTDDNVMLFHFPSKVRFMVNGQIVDHDIFVDSPKHDFYFSLEKEPSIVRFDPDYGLLADITFEKPTEMLYAQLENEDDMIGRLLAIESLKKKKDKKTVSKLKDTLDNDSFYGVRISASTALREIHTNEAFDAIIFSLTQYDARVRQQVIKDLGGFYRPESFDNIKQVLKSEKNPDILNTAIRSLGRYHHKDTKTLLLKYLKSTSYRNGLADAAVEAIRMLDDPSFIPPLLKVIRSREREFTSWGFTQALDALAHIARNKDDRKEVRTFLAKYVNHPKQLIQERAIKALGTLSDPAAIPIIQTFSGDDKNDPVQKSAKAAIEEIRKQKEVVPAEIISLRETVDELKKVSDELKSDMEDIKKRLDANQEDEDKDDEK